MRTNLKLSRQDWTGLTALLAMALILFGSWPSAKTMAAMGDNDDDDQVEITAPIISLPNTADFTGEWTVGRAKIKVTAATKIDQTRGKVAIGALVEVEGVKQNDGSITATEIEVKLSPASGLPIKFTGKIEELPSTAGRVGDWKVSGKIIHVTTATKIEQERGQVAVGATVEIEGLAQSDGSINALEIEVKPDAANGIPVKFLGKIEKLPSTTGRIGDWVVSGRTVRVSANTQLKQERGEPMIGSLVDVEGLAQLDGVILANKIEVRANIDNPNIFVSFRGMIEALPGAANFIGDWKVSGRVVRVSADTKVDQEDGKVIVGAFVEVKGTLQTDGSVKAANIEVKEAPNPTGYVRFLGVIKMLPASTSNTPSFIGDWKVGERTVRVTADTKLEQEKARIAVGVLVEVEGTLRNDGSIDAKKIETKSATTDTANYVRFFGTITALPANNTLIGDWTVGGKTIHVGERTRIRQEHGAPRVGAYIEVEGNQRTDGSIDAYKIEVERDAGAPDGTIGFINFYGPIKSITSTANFVGTFTVGDKQVSVTEMTKLDTRRGQITVGAFVEVFGYLLGNGSVRAIKIEVRPVPTNTNANINRSFVEFIGDVSKLPETKNFVGVWVVGNRTVHVKERTVIHRERALVAVGATVEIIGAELPNGEIDAKFIEVSHGPAGSSFLTYSPLTSVNAGSYLGGNSASAIIASFGGNLATSTVLASSLPLPTTLGGVSVLIDGRPAGLFFVSPNQINYLAPEGMLPGQAQVTVLKNGAVAAQGSLTLGSIAPSLFTANASGQGVPAGVLLRVKANGQQSFEPLARFDAGQNKFVPATITRGPGDRLFLVLYGTGLRGAEDSDRNGANGGAENFEVFIGNAKTSALFAGVAPGFAGLDQLNVEIPASVKGANITVLIKAHDGEGKVHRANGVTITIQ